MLCAFKPDENTDKTRGYGIITILETAKRSVLGFVMYTKQDKTQFTRMDLPSLLGRLEKRRPLGQDGRIDAWELLDEIYVESLSIELLLFLFASLGQFDKESKISVGSRIYCLKQAICFFRRP